MQTCDCGSLVSRADFTDRSCRFAAQARNRVDSQSCRAGSLFVFVELSSMVVASKFLVQDSLKTCSLYNNNEC